MTLFQIYTRIVHMFTALHWRGYAIHSPMMYSFVREVVITSPRKVLPRKIEQRYSQQSVASFDSVAKFASEVAVNKSIDVAMIVEPYISRAERDLMYKWHAENHAVVVHLQGLLVLFFDPKLQKQFYKIRN